MPRARVPLQVFRGKIGSLRKGLRAYADFVFVDAPHAVEAPSDSDLKAAGGENAPRAWWTWKVSFCTMPCPLAKRHYHWTEDWTWVATGR